MSAYNKFLGKGIDLAPLGINRTTEHDSVYFCTPVGYSLIGWTGVDGIHYCFIRGFGDMVFSVSPSNCPGEYVHPVAKSFEDFLRLLLSCAGEAAIEQAWGWDREQFQNFMADNLPDDQAEQTMLLLEQKLKLTPIEDPFAYIKDLQRDFDYSKIKFSSEYHEVVCEEEPADQNMPWEVCFESGSGRGKPGEEIPVCKWFRWGVHTYYLPAVYACEKGLVADLLVRVSQEEAEELEQRYAAASDEEERERISEESPFSMRFEGTMEINRTQCGYRHSRGAVWYPKRPEECDHLARQMVAHYDLDPGYIWMLYRMSFPWATKRKPKVKSLNLMLESEPVSVPGPKFTPNGPGDKVNFIHPVTGTEHTLEVLSYEERELGDTIDDPCWSYPDRCWVMEYTMTPELPERSWQVRDCAESDVTRPGKSGGLSEEEAAALSIIGGADGPVAVMVATTEHEEGRYEAISSLHFEPAERVEWKLTFHAKKVEDLTVKLL